MFNQIYANNLWGGTETRSGPGSSMLATEILRRVLPELVAGILAVRVLDAACGEAFWMPDLPGVSYLGVDIVPEAIAKARKNHRDRYFMVADIRKDRLPRTQVVICRDAMMHMPLADGVACIENFRRTRARWLLATTFEDGENVDVQPGEFYRPDLTAEPFNLVKPWMVIEDGVATNPDERKSQGKYLGVFAL